MPIIKKIFRLTLFLLLSFVAVSCSSVNLQKLGNINPGELPYTGDNKFYPGSIAVDSYNNIYVSDRNTKRIFKYNNEMKPLSVIQLDSSMFNADIINFYTIELQTDNDANLYAFIKSEYAYYNIVKYDKTGKLVPLIFEFKSAGTDVHLSHTGKIFVPIPLAVFPNALVDSSFRNKGMVCVYNTSGKFLGRTDCFAEDSKGNGYKRNLLNNEKLEINTYKMPSAGVVMPSRSILTGTIKADQYESRQWGFLGFDIYDNAYFLTDDNRDVIVKRINVYEEKDDEIRISRNDFNRYGIAFRYYNSNIAISPGGEIYFAGISSNDSSAVILKAAFDK